LTKNIVLISYQQLFHADEMNIQDSFHLIENDFNMLFFLPRKPNLTELGKSVNISTIWGQKASIKLLRRK